MPENTTLSIYKIKKFSLTFHYVDKSQVILTLAASELEEEPAP